LQDDTIDQNSNQALGDVAVSKSERKARRKARQLRRQAQKIAKIAVADNSTLKPEFGPDRVECEDYLKSNNIAIHEPVGYTTPTLPVIDFERLAIPGNLKAVLRDFDKPTPIQACSWPALLAGSDVIGIAETGR
jgi:ATP-dependent RNA helicase DBP3